jgi:hypothetical protein
MVIGLLAVALVFVVFVLPQALFEAQGEMDD